MSEFIFKLPDLGEGTVEAEIIEWHVKPGDAVAEGDVIVDVMTDKANIEVPSPTTGTVLRTTGEPGDMVAVGAELIAFGTGSAPADAAPVQPEAVAEPELEPQTEPEPEPQPETAPAQEPARVPQKQGKVLASPALRRKAMELGINLGDVPGSGPRGRILRRDLEAYAGGSAPAAPQVAPQSDDVEEIKVIGVRRVIAERMQAAKREIPHFAYVEELDITALEDLRKDLNQRSESSRLTYLPFLGLALIRALRAFPQCNQRYDAERGVLQRYRAVHLGVATQTPDGLKVPVVHDAHRLNLWQLAEAISEVTEQARSGSAGAKLLSGSTITITSLGKLGGIASTPVINAPEMGIIGVNKAVLRPTYIDGNVVPRLMMNLSSSFDHRFVDGFDAASMIQELKALLEQPALMFVPVQTM